MISLKLYPYFIVVCIVFSQYCGVTLLSQNLYNLQQSYDYTPSTHASNLKISDFTIIRLYCIARLHRMIDALKKINNLCKKREATKDKQLYTLLFPSDSKLFTHPTILNVISSINNTQNIDPMIETWSCIKYYRSIEDLPLIEEFTRLGIVIMKNSLMTSLLKPNIAKSLFFDAIQSYINAADLPFNQLIDNIDTLSDYFLILANNKSVSNDEFDILTKTLQKNEDPTATNVLPSTVMNRFYYIHRISKTFSSLEKFKYTPLTKVILKPKVDRKRTSLIDQSIVLNNNLIQKCVERIEQTKKLEPLFNLWQVIRDYKRIDDDSFMKEFIAVLISLLKNFLTDIYQQQEQSPFSLDEAMDMYEDINSLNILELLDLLDIFTDTFSDFSHTSTVGFETPAWQKWLLSQSWFPPVIALAGILLMFSQKS